MTELLTAENIGYGVAGLGVVVMTLSKLFGFIHFGRKDDSCPDPNCKKTVIELGQSVAVIQADVAHIKETYTVLVSKVDKTAQGVAFIEGWIKKNGKS